MRTRSREIKENTRMNFANCELDERRACTGKKDRKITTLKN